MRFQRALSTPLLMFQVNAKISENHLEVPRYLQEVRCSSQEHTGMTAKQPFIAVTPSKSLSECHDLCEKDSACNSWVLNGKFDMCYFSEETDLTSTDEDDHHAYTVSIDNCNDQRQTRSTTWNAEFVKIEATLDGLESEKELKLTYKGPDKNTTGINYHIQIMDKSCTKLVPNDALYDKGIVHDATSGRNNETIISYIDIITNKTENSTFWERTNASGGIMRFCLQMITKNYFGWLLGVEETKITLNIDTTNDFFSNVTLSSKWKEPDQLIENVTTKYLLFATFCDKNKEDITGTEYGPGEIMYVCVKSGNVDVEVSDVKNVNFNHNESSISPFLLVKNEFGPNMEKFDEVKKDCSTKIGICQIETVVFFGLFQDNNNSSLVDTSVGWNITGTVALKFTRRYLSRSLQSGQPKVQKTPITEFKLDLTLSNHKSEPQGPDPNNLKGIEMIIYVLAGFFLFIIGFVFGVKEKSKMLEQQDCAPYSVVPPETSTSSNIQKVGAVVVIENEEEIHCHLTPRTKSTTISRIPTKFQPNYEFRTTRKF